MRVCMCVTLYVSTMCAFACVSEFVFVCVHVCMFVHLHVCAYSARVVMCCVASLHCVALCMRACALRDTICEHNVCVCLCF